MYNRSNDDWSEILNTTVVTNSQICTDSFRLDPKRQTKPKEGAVWMLHVFLCGWYVGLTNSEEARGSYLTSPMLTFHPP